MISVGFIGVGKLGKDAAEVMAEHYDVTGYDINPVETSVIMASRIEGAIKGKDIIFIAVPTPHHEAYDGRYPTTELVPKNFDYSILIDVIKKVEWHTNTHPIVVVISTVLPGTIRRHIAPLLTKGNLVYNPYFIAQGTVKRDMRFPEMNIIGTDKGEENDVYKTMVNFYSLIVMKQAAPRFIPCTWDEGEAIKVFYNTFITAKICFVNMIQDTAERVGNINADVVTYALSKSTMRLISDRYMKAGLGDGGGCHPRDNIALSWLALEYGFGYDLFRSLMEVREQQAHNMAKKLVFAGKDVVILGKAFKPGVDQTNGSPSILVGHYVASWGKKVFYDEAPDDKPYVYLIAHPGEYKYNEGSVVVDPWRCHEAGVKAQGVEYIPYGDTRMQR